MTGDTIKTMKLYSRVERVYAQLRDAGIGDGDPIPLDVLCRFDQYHYDGTAAVDEGIARLALEPHHRVLDVGSGLGGPARFIASRAGCKVTALELQPDLHEVASRLTERCGLAHLVRHRCGDVLEGPVPPGRFDALFAWLAFLHIPERERLYRRCYEALRPGGALYVEDYFERGAFTGDERETLAAKVYSRNLPRLDELGRDLGRAGFAGVEIEDVTASWTGHVTERARAWRADRCREVALHGEEVFAGLDDFYSTIAGLFRGGNLGGVRLLARKPRTGPAPGSGR